MYPIVKVNIKKYRENCRRVKQIAEERGLTVVPVTKAFSAMPELVQALYEEGFSVMADARIENLKSIGERTKATTLLLRLPMISEADDVVQYADISLNSEWETIVALDRAAREVGKTHRVIVMVELGDLREGMPPDQVLELCRQIGDLQNIALEGIGCNLTCYGGVIPTQENLGVLVELAEEIEQALSIRLPVISGGNSSAISLLMDGTLPSSINQLRLGEFLMLGNDTASGEHVKGYHNDIFVLEAALIELKEKDSVPTGIIGFDAFGQVPTFEDRGRMLRGIVAVGKQDTVLDKMVPLDPEIEIIGGSSDHILLDMTARRGAYKVGDVISFRLEYPAILGVFTSKYVKKIIE